VSVSFDHVCIDVALTQEQSNRFSELCPALCATRNPLDAIKEI
jgi:hypothetical protein